MNNRYHPAILIIDDDESYCALLTAFIRSSYPQAAISPLDPNEYSLGAVEDETNYKDYDLIFLDYELGGFKNGLDWYMEHSSSRSLPPTILNSAYVDETTAKKALAQGIIDFLPKTQVSELRVKIGIDQAILYSKTAAHDIEQIAKAKTLQLDLGHLDIGPTVAFDDANESYALNTENGKIAEEKLYIEEYQLLRQIGQGGMARIYHALDKDKNDIAVKVFVPDDELPEDFFKRFIAEGNVLSGIDHPNIIKVFDTGYTDEYGFIAMELLSEKTLASYDYPLEIDKAVSLIGDISSGLAAVHQKGIVHRDIKPSNILFSKDGVPKLADFGIAKDLSADLNLTRQGTAVGTPSYMSPEQVLGDPISHLSDLYAIGVLFYQLLTGEVPFTSHNHIEVMTDHAQTPAPHLQENMYALDIVTQTLLQKKPHDRYLSANILHHELMTILSYGLYS